MLPEGGALAIGIAGITGVSVNANTTGAAVRFRWPYMTMLTGIDMTVRSGSDADLAGTRLRILDDQGVELASNMQGFVGMSGLMARGILPLNHTFGGRFVPFQRIVRAGDLWVFQIINANGVAVVPDVFFRLGRVATVYNGRAA